MSRAFYSHARLYDLMFSGGGPAVEFYRAQAGRQGGSVLEVEWLQGDMRGFELGSPSTSC